MADIKEVIKKSTKYKKGEPLSSFKMMYDSPQNQLEPTYYWILDFMEDAQINVEKVTDNFMSSPGSGHFSEMGQKATAMQQQATKILGDVNTVIKSIQNLVYDLKEFEIRLKHYERAKSDKEKEKEQGMLALKNIWLDQVDLKRGRGSIHQMAAEMGFTTLREAFLIANTPEDVEKMAREDGVINESVKRILLPRLSEFLIWTELSEKELSKRFEIEKAYLRSQVESLKMYTRWARPYLKAAKELRMKGFEKNPALVNAFSTTMFELTLLGKKEVKGPPKGFEESRHKVKRKYYSVYLINFEFRGHLAQKAGQGSQSGYNFAFGGRVDMTFDSYALNSEELAIMEKQLTESDLEDGLGMVEDDTNNALAQLKDDLDHFLDYTNKQEEKLGKKKDEKKGESDINPFSALFSVFKVLKKEEKKEEIVDVKDVKKDNFVEEILRKEAETGAKDMLYAVYDVYKKAHGMASSPESFDY